MNFIELALRFIAGGSLVVLVTLIGRSSYPQLAGLAVMFPVITITSFSFLIASKGAEAVRPMLLFSLLSLPTLIVFLFILYTSLGRVSTLTSFILGLVGWFCMASFIYVVDARWLHLVFKP